MAQNALPSQCPSIWWCFMTSLKAWLVEAMQYFMGQNNPDYSTSEKVHIAISRFRLCFACLLAVMVPAYLPS